MTGRVGKSQIQPVPENLFILGEKTDQGRFYRNLNLKVI